MEHRRENRVHYASFIDGWHVAQQPRATDNTVINVVQRGDVAGAMLITHRRKGRVPDYALFHHIHDVKRCGHYPTIPLRAGAASPRTAHLAQRIKSIN